jgi:hypothetical protein
MKSTSEKDMVENKIAQNDIKASISRRNTIDQEIHVKKEEPVSIRRPSSCKPDSRFKTPIVTTKKEIGGNGSGSRPVIVPSRVINSAASNKRISETPTNNMENNNYNMNMKMNPSSGNLRSNNSSSSSHHKYDINKGININSNK